MATCESWLISNSNPIANSYANAIFTISCLASIKSSRLSFRSSDGTTVTSMCCRFPASGRRRSSSFTVRESELAARPITHQSRPIDSWFRYKVVAVERHLANGDNRNDGQRASAPANETMPSSFESSYGHRDNDSATVRTPPPSPLCLCNTIAISIASQSPMRSRMMTTGDAHNQVLITLLARSRFACDSRELPSSTSSAAAAVFNILTIAHRIR